MIEVATGCAIIHFFVVTRVLKLKIDIEGYYIDTRYDEKDITFAKLIFNGRKKYPDRLL